MILKKENIVHIVERIHRATGSKDLVLVGSSALIATAKALPASLMMTEEVDIYARDAVDPEEWETKVQIHFGQGSIYSNTFKYYADPVSSTTAILPSDWNDRAVALNMPGRGEVTVTCPSSNDLALSKLCAWREKDRGWLVECGRMLLINLEVMRSLAKKIIPTKDGLGTEEITRRLDSIAFELLPPGERKARIAANSGKPIPQIDSEAPAKTRETSREDGPRPPEVEQKSLRRKQSTRPSTKAMIRKKDVRGL